MPHTTLVLRTQFSRGRKMKQIFLSCSIIIVLCACGNTSKDEFYQTEPEPKTAETTVEPSNGPYRLPPNFNPSDYQGCTDEFERYHRDGRKLTKEELKEHHKELFRRKEAKIVDSTLEPSNYTGKADIRREFSGLYSAYGNLLQTLATLRSFYLQENPGFTAHNQNVQASAACFYTNKAGLSIASNLSNTKYHYAAEGYIQLTNNTAWVGSVNYFEATQKGHITSYSTGILHKPTNSTHITATIGNRDYNTNISNHYTSLELNPFAEISFQCAVNSEYQLGLSTILEKTLTTRAPSVTQSYLFMHYQHQLLGNYLKLNARIGMNLKTSSVEQLRLGFQLEG